MTGISIALMIIAMLITLGVLFAGVIVMAIGGEVNKKWGNRLMRYRVLAQLVALALFFVAVTISKSGG